MNPPAPAVPLEVRRLGPGDIEAARALNALFARAFEDPEHYASAPPPADWLAGLLADPGVVALVAFRNGALAGALTGYVLRKFEQARAEFYIYDLAVEEAHRRQGVATALINAARAEAARLGASVVFVQADPVDEPAVALYDGLGRREEVYHFDMTVPGAASTAKPADDA